MACARQCGSEISHCSFTQPNEILTIVAYRDRDEGNENAQLTVMTAASCPCGGGVRIVTRLDGESL